MDSGREPSGAQPRLRSALAGADELVFLCSGNMVRSAFAELYARHRGCPLAVRSGATTFRNDALFPETAEALRRRGVSDEWIGTFRPTHIDELLPTVGERAILFGMTRGHLDALVPWTRLREKAFLLAEVTGRSEDIADPVMDGADFAATFARVAACVEDLIRYCVDPRPFAGPTIP